ncbi:MAG TPA: Glu-tRNA(Gln) amidotransferase subunit GatE [Candidatus Poseidoniales archaeon]|nr:MAG: Glu-tRNA(Gln) amidotransferase GatDE subunit E [Euryarchaeota archaeon]HIF46021.1 Glu-tRNA(Gln) amidotransferase subunit GatE [Candidatus Poseidoniales archaeon]HIL65869.1 Glu-tRNA(Gln) amidotransferase subunit GatE [Candidatus Poseidoniales archaeon]
MEPVGEVSAPANLDPEGLGFMCGIEVHQQLATGKLHSRQPGQLHDITIDTLPESWPRFARKLRAARGEGGNIDVAARFEARRNRSFIYCQSPNSGLIELDEQPPLPHDEDALDIALTVSAMLNAHPVPLLQTMRKTVVDGSNTSGFQRTTLISTAGILQTEGGPVGVDVLCLEEDSARKLANELTPNGEVVTWNLDRLGIPLIEIATAPDVKNPDHAKQTSKALGRCLRDTRRVRRGLGSIRQDLNVSLMCGDRVEIKGCQDLDWIPKIIRCEMARQLHFYRLANILRSNYGFEPLGPDRRISSPSVDVESILPLKLVDVSESFANCQSKMVQNGLGAGSKMLALPLPGFAELIGTKTLDEDGAQMPRLGRELAGAAKLAGVAGIFHSDELPAYGIDQEFVDATRAELNGVDAFVLCLAAPWQAELALESVLNRARLAFDRIAQEVRNVVVKKGAPEDGTTSPMRPLPGGARMYPETDIPPFIISSDRWNQIQLPMTVQERAERMANFAISQDQAKQLVARELDDHFVNHHLGLPLKAWASMLLENEGDIGLMALVLAAKEEGHLTREGMAPLLIQLKNSNPTISEIAELAENLGLKPADEGDLAAIVDKVIQSRADFIKERGMAALGPLMGVVMKECGGAADGKQVSALLREAILRLGQ